MRPMSLVANLLLWASVVVGLIASTTAYSPRLDAVPTDADAPLVLAAPAGVDPDDPDRPLYAPDTELTAEVVEALRANRRPGAPDEPVVTRVKVKAFDLGRWDHGWAFLVAAVGLIGSAIMLRADAKRRAAASLGGAPAGAAQADPGVATGSAVSPAGVAPHAAEGPERALAEARVELDALVQRLHGLSEADQLAAILERIGHVQRTHFAAFVDDRPVITARFGVGGYARIMDRFAAAERVLNRAWSAAADRVLAEARLCLDEGITRLVEAEQAVRAG